MCYFICELHYRIVNGAYHMFCYKRLDLVIWLRTTGLKELVVVRVLPTLWTREFPPHFYKYYLQIKQIVKLQVLLFSDSWVHIRMQVSLGLEDFQL